MEGAGRADWAQYPAQLAAALSAPGWRPSRGRGSFARILAGLVSRDTLPRTGALACGAPTQGSFSGEVCVLHYLVVYDTMSGWKRGRSALRAEAESTGLVVRALVTSSRPSLPPSSTPTIETDDATQAVIVRWVGNDERCRELEIIAIEAPDCRLVVHVMPTQYRRNR